jgi:hypothetical protein
MLSKYAVMEEKANIQSIRADDHELVKQQMNCSECNWRFVCLCWQHVAEVQQVFCMFAAET